MASQPYIGMIYSFGFNFAPRGWHLCDGSLLPISQYTALYAIIGTTYGGDGISTFGLPDLRGRTLVHQGQGPGLGIRVMGQMAGAETVTLASTEIPAHSHLIAASNAVGTTRAPSGAFPAATSRAEANDYAAANDGSALSAQSVGLTGGSQPHNNLPPYLVVNYCIALEGVFPARN
ncbi:MAG: phage tail protein [Verrucomicrobia bacterium]|nr:phage tail protein [Verrucomicrobiota bacterium]